MFALELTHDFNMLLPLLVAVHRGLRVHGAVAEALDPDREGGRRGFHLSREYAVDPLELHYVRDVVSTPGEAVELPLETDANGTHGLSVDDYETVPAISAVATLRTAARVMARSGATRLVVVHPDRPQEVAGVIELQDLLKAYRKNLDIEEARSRHLELPSWRGRRNGA